MSSFSQKTEWLLTLNRHNLRLMVGTLTGHCGLQRHLHLLGIVADGTCPKCGKEQETAIHLVAECEAFAVLRFRTLGSDILSTNELKTVEWQKVLDFVRQTNRMISRMPLFGKSTKSPAEVVKALKEAVNALEKGEKKVEKAQEDVSKNLVLIKNMLYGTSDSEPQTDIILAQLAQELYNSNLLLLLIQNLNRIEFEGKKDVAQVFNNILRRQIGTRSPTVEYICTKPEILFTLMNGYEHQDIALNCGTMLRECARYEALAKIMLHSEHFYDFFRYVEVSTFDIASDAFSTFKELLTRHKMLCAEFLENNYDKVFTHYQRLLNSENYVTRRQSLKLLGELLLDRHNFTVMTRYISNPDNLKLMMNMLKEKSRNIQFEAFHVFKVFVANPNKPKPILDILLRNQDKLVEFLTKFHTDRSEDEQFNDEKAYLIKQIRELKPLPDH